MYSHQKYLFQVLQPGKDISGRSVSLESREGEQVSTFHLPRVKVSNYRQTKCTSNDSLWSELASEQSLLTMVKPEKMVKGFGETSIRVDGIATVKG